MNAIPGRCAVALKEWAGICQALASGLQTVLLRKGGIREREGRFLPEYEAFWLYPTQMHQAQQGLRGQVLEPDHGAGVHEVRIDSLAQVRLVEYVERKDTLDTLEPFHVWTPETVGRRFDYRTPGLWVMAVRVYRRAEPWTLVPTSNQVGCQSWVHLDEEVSTEGLLPVLEDDAAEDRLETLRGVLAVCRGARS